MDPSCSEKHGQSYAKCGKGCADPAKPYCSFNSGNCYPTKAKNYYLCCTKFTNTPTHAPGKTPTPPPKPTPPPPSNTTTPAPTSNSTPAPATPPPSKPSNGKADVKLKLEGSIEEYTKAVKDQMKDDIAKSVGINASEIELIVAAGSVVATATMPKSSAEALVAKVKSKELKTLGGKTIDSAEIAGTATPTPTKPSGPPPSPTPPPESNKKSKVSAGVIVAIVLGVAVVLGAGCFFFAKRNAHVQTDVPYTPA